MKILSNIKTVGGNVVATLTIHDVTSGERERIQQFGEPEVDFGSAFDSDDVPVDIDNVTFTLPARLLNLTSGFPVVAAFDLDDIPAASQHARVWVATCVERCSQALIELNALVPADFGDMIHTIPTVQPG